MNEDLYRIVYCSRNLIRGDEKAVSQELQTILSKSRINNAAAAITGALLYSSGSFAQVLEGRLSAIERVFEVIQRDLRHSEVTVVQIGPITSRQFPEWSMALAGKSNMDSRPETIAAFDAVFSQRSGGGEQILNILQDLVVSDIDWILLGTA